MNAARTCFILYPTPTEAPDRDIHQVYTYTPYACTQLSIELYTSSHCAYHHVCCCVAYDEMMPRNRSWHNILGVGAYTLGTQDAWPTHTCHASHILHPLCRPQVVATHARDASLIGTPVVHTVGGVANRTACCLLGGVAHTRVAGCEKCSMLSNGQINTTYINLS